MKARSRPVFLLFGLAFLAAAVLALWRRHALRDDWLAEMRASGCSPILELPHVGPLVWGAAVCSLLAVGLFLAHLWCSGRRTTQGAVVGSVLAGSVLAVFAAALLIGSVFLATTTPTDANDGLDGSGLPCPSSA